MKKEQIIFIVGPTGIGKSSVAVELAKKISGEIVSADSMQIYKGMDIGTAKISPQEMKGVPHHLLDLLSVSEPMDVSQFRKRAMQVIKEIFSREKTPIVVGGTGLYVRSLTDGLFEGPACNPDLRKKLNQLADEKGNEVLYRELKKIDPKAADKIELNDRRRMIRALEVYEAEKKPVSDLRTNWGDKNNALGHPFVLFGLSMDRERLYNRLNQRVNKMFDLGLIAEAENLLKQGLKKNPTAFQAIGYKELAAYLNGETSLETCREKVKQATRHFAKRQWTWFRRDPRVEWVEVRPEDSIEKIAEILYNKIERIRK